MKAINLFWLVIIIAASCQPTEQTDHSEKVATEIEIDSIYIQQHYTKAEYRIPMRDGKTLFTAVYTPKDTSEKYPFIMKRTPYSCRPYGVNKYPNSLGASNLITQEKFIFVFQDVRGRFMSEGEFVNMRPVLQNHKSDSIDESTDTYDTIEWLLKNVDNNNGNAAIMGISYPGFYATTAAISAHPAVKVVLPKCPIADWWFDDFHHHGTFFAPHFLNFYRFFGQKRESLTKTWPAPMFEHDTNDGYQFFMELGALSNVNEQLYHHQIAFWDSVVAHPNYDHFWQSRNVLPHVKDIKPAVIVVGGWFDAEDLYGPLATYKAIENFNENNSNHLVMGPWAHGGMSRTSGKTLGDIYFSKNPTPSEFYQKELELAALNYYLKNKGEFNPAEATLYDTGAKKWREFDSWPPDNLVKYYLNQDNKLSNKTPKETNQFLSFTSDPSAPVPFTQKITTGMPKTYMLADQRFVADREDVLLFSTGVLENDITLAGEIAANLIVSTNKGDADWIVKLIDVYPDNHEGFANTPDTVDMGGYQQLVRSELFRGRYRKSYSLPEPFTPNTADTVNFPLQDVVHTFKKGHQIMIQIHSTWFPISDRNPQKYVENIYQAEDSDFEKAEHKVYMGKNAASYIALPVWQENK